MPFKFELDSSYQLDYSEKHVKKIQLSPLAGMALSVDTSDKIPVNGVDLLNRHELSPYQDKELQRFIDENAHILSWKEREKLEQQQRCLSTGSNYSSLSRDLNRGLSPQQGYRSLERKHSNEPVYTEIGKSNVKFIPPNINGHNYTTDFPGMEQLSDNSFLLQFGGRIPQNATNRPASAQGSYAQSGYADTSRYSSLSRGGAGASGYGSQSAHNYGTQNYDTSTYGSDIYGTLGAPADPYAYSNSSLGRGGLARPSSAAAGGPSPYGTLKSRKGVSWLDQERARSLSPTHNKPQQPLMSQYGSAGNLNLREQTGSPAYSNIGKHADNYNRFETQRHREAQAGRQKSPFDDSRFGGFGDRPGSGVELTGHQWNGGEIINDPHAVPKGLRTRKLFYSPIGDGTVAADGYELKRRPVDLSPRVTITQLQHVDRGEKGRDGVNIYEKSWTNTMGSAPSEAGYGSDYGPGSGRNSRAGALSPSAGAGGPGSGLGSGAGGPGAGGPSNGFGGKDPNAGRGAGDPFGSGNLGPHSGLGGDPFGSNGNLEPRDGRTSATPSIPFSDRSSYRFDTKTGYLITNPRELIHQYATTTPVATMELNDNTPSTTTITKQSMYRRTEETTEERFSPYAPYKGQNPVPPPNKFVRQLRDDTMTHSQREANTHQDPMNLRDPQSQQRIHQIQTKTYSRSGHDDIDSLTNQLVSGLKSTTPVPNRFA